MPGIYIDAAYALALASSVVVGHPLIGHGYAVLFGRDDTWRRDRRLRRVFAVTTLGWSAISAVRAAVQAGLYRADLTELLALAKLALGWPLTALAVVVTVAAVRRATPPHLRGGPGWHRPNAQSRSADARSHWAP